MMDRAVIVAALLLMGCSPEPPAPVSDEPPTVPADDLPSTTVSAAPMVTSNQAPPMSSYEVAIAIAAANRKKAEADCSSRPTAERETCLSAIASEWDTTRTALEDLRGEQH